MSGFDFSTISVEEARKLPQWEDTGRYHLQKDPGNGCMLDPPGYPTYFTRCIYTKLGNNPSSGPQMVLCIPEGNFVVQDDADWKGRDWNAVSELWKERMRKLYVPLPLDHPRVKAWMVSLFGYFRNSYVDMSKPADKRRNVAELKNSGSVMEHRAVVDIRDVYPGFIPEVMPGLPKIADGKWGKGSPGDWWERYAEAPSPCPGIHGHPHMSNGSWCQMCGQVA